MGIFGRGSSTRSSYGHNDFSVAARGKSAGAVRRSLDWLLPPKVVVVVTLSDWQPCLDCFACVMTDVRKLAGAHRLLVDYPRGEIELKMIDRQRRSPLLGEDFYKITAGLEETMAFCRTDHPRHSQHQAA